jgi:hypothetical protein
LALDLTNIPAAIKSSAVLTGNNLGQLGNVEVLPTSEEIAEHNKTISKTFVNDTEKHQYAKTLLDANKVKEAWCVLLG